MKNRPKPKSKLSPRYKKPVSKRRRIVQALARDGYNGDVIAASLGVNKNYLRSEYALDLQAGREIRAAEEAAEAAEALSKKEQERLDCIKASFDSHWYSPEHGNLLFGDTHSVEEALAWCKRNFGDRWG